MIPMPRWITVLVGGVIATVVASAQTTQIELAEVHCPSVLGVGINTDLVFCDVVIQQEAGLGTVVLLPARRGEATLSFNLHNRHTYSEEEVRTRRAFAAYTAEVAIASMEGDVLARRFIQTEFRSVDDLVDRVTGGAGPQGVKAIAPSGTERVFVTVPVELDEVVIVGQGLEVVRLDSRDNFRTAGRPIAVVSDVRVEYQAR